MLYFLIFLMSFLLNIYSPADDTQPTTKITFESASLVYSNANQGDWNFLTTINETDITKGEVLEFQNDLEALTFFVTGSTSDKTASESQNDKMFVEEIALEEPSILNTYGSNAVTIDHEELLRKKPDTLKIHTGFKEKKEELGSSLLTPTTEVVFTFTLDYN